MSRRRCAALVLLAALAAYPPPNRVDNLSRDLDPSSCPGWEQAP